MKKSDKKPFIIYTNLDSLIKRINGYENNPEKLSTLRVGEHIPGGYSISMMDI